MATTRHTHNFRKCSHASVGLAQARPNNWDRKNCLLYGVVGCLLLGGCF